MRLDKFLELIEDLVKENPELLENEVLESFTKLPVACGKGNKFFGTQNNLIIYEDDEGDDDE